MHGQDGGSVDIDDFFARRSMENFGDFIVWAEISGCPNEPTPYVHDSPRRDEKARKRQGNEG
jgi:hypothetical protein